MDCRRGLAMKILSDRQSVKYCDKKKQKICFKGASKISKVVDFLLVLIELFSLGVTAKALRANIGSISAISLQRGRGSG